MKPRQLADIATASPRALYAVLLAWGPDLAREDGKWSIERERDYKQGAKIKDPFQLRINSYRVLLTRSRDGTVVFFPTIDRLNETAEYLAAAAFRVLED